VERSRISRIRIGAETQGQLNGINLSRHSGGALFRAPPYLSWMQTFHGNVLPEPEQPIKLSNSSNPNERQKSQFSLVHPRSMTINNKWDFFRRCRSE
jgi:hypothetical protein